MVMYELTCKNHTGSRYLTKNPWERNLHLVETDPTIGRECDCPFRDLVVTHDGEFLPVPVPVNDFLFRVMA